MMLLLLDTTLSWHILRNIPLGSGADGNALAVEVFPQTVVKLCQPPQLEISHRLAGLLDLRRVANIAGGVLRHLEGRVASAGRNVEAGQES